MVNLEMQWWHTNDIADPPSWQRMQIYPNPMLGSDKSARMVNSAGEEFFNQQQDDPLAYGPYTVQLKALARASSCGESALRRRLFRGLRSLRSARGRSLHDLRRSPFISSACPSRRQLLETAVTAHYRQGGIDVDTGTMQSSVPGLYVAGGLGGHSNGLIGLATYDGKVAAEGVMAELSRLAICELPQQQIASERARIDATAVEAKRRRRARRGQEPHPCRDVGKGRRREERRQASPRPSRISQTSGSIYCRGSSVTRTARAINYEWLDAIDAVNMVDVCELIIHSSLERKESRGPFIRRDFPLQDNACWLAANVMKRTQNGFRFERRSYELPFFKPDFATANNLEVAW